MILLPLPMLGLGLWWNQLGDALCFVSPGLRPPP